jgi:branched-chain amino acid transport system ATP-binding protein
MPALRLVDVSAGYGEVEALQQVSMRVDAGSSVAIVGSNGAGKSTLVKSINGLLTIRSGQVLWQGENVSGWPGHKRTLSGIATVAEGRLLFGDLTVAENLAAASQSGEARRRRPESLDLVFRLFPRLRERQHQQAATMSGGEQQMLAIGRALMTLPKLLVLDEPSIGLAPRVVGEIFQALATLKKSGMALLLIEQNIELSLRSVDYAYVLARGRVVEEGAAQTLLASPAINEAYFGT